jgi:peptidoglycan/LPS O-acetylase OafA/YrhL
VSITYRPEIDGLRAIAVTSVVLYHAGIGGAGFVGVDIFFVISGYLITALLLREQEATGRIDLPAFYSRRVRRIFPAAFVLVLAVLAAAPLLLSSQRVVQVQQSATAAALFAANLFFHGLTNGYFAPASDEMPLLHLWSLAVEEQFYFVWPLLLIVVPRRFILAGLIVVALASFTLAEWLMQGYPGAAFYHMPPRAWELAVGGVVAAMPHRALPRWLAPAAIALILGACAIPFGDFPGLGALPVVMGTGALLWSIHGGATSALLASGPMVGLGLISYSIYLWHWPLLAFYRATSVGEGSAIVRAGLCVAAVGIAWASCRWVEQPARRVGWGPRQLLAVGASGAFGLAFGAFVLTRITSGSLLLDSAADARATLALHDVVPIPTEQPKDARLVVWGDSYARTWLPVGRAIAGSSTRLIGRAGCPPLVGYAPPMTDAVACVRHNAETIQQLTGRPTVLMAFHWQRYAGDFPRFDAALADTLQRVSASAGEVLVVMPTPEMLDEVPKCIRLGQSCAVARADFDQQADPWRKALAKHVAALPNVRLIDPTDLLCSASQCPDVREGVALYSDKSHLSASASAFLAKRIRL